MVGLLFAFVSIWKLLFSHGYHCMHNYGSPYRSIPVYRSTIGMVRTELYWAILSIPTHGTWECTNVPLISVPYQTGIYWYVTVQQILCIRANFKVMTFFFSGYFCSSCWGIQCASEFGNLFDYWLIVFVGKFIFLISATYTLHAIEWHWLE